MRLEFDIRTVCSPLLSSPAQAFSMFDAATIRLLPPRFVVWVHDCFTSQLTEAGNQSLRLWSRYGNG
jgi:hypothetical protein